MGRQTLALFLLGFVVTITLVAYTVLAVTEHGSETIGLIGIVTPVIGTLLLGAKLDAAKNDVRDHTASTVRDAVDKAIHSKSFQTQVRKALADILEERL